MTSGQPRRDRRGNARNAQSKLTAINRRLTRRTWTEPPASFSTRGPDCWLCSWLSALSARV